MLGLALTLWLSLDLIYGLMLRLGPRTSVNVNFMLDPSHEFPHLEKQLLSYFDRSYLHNNTHENVNFKCLKGNSDKKSFKTNI